MCLCFVDKHLQGSVNISDTVLDVMELLRGADNTQKLWQLIQQPGAIEVLMHSADKQQVNIVYTWITTSNPIDKFTHEFYHLY